nr:hypothetical protein [Actinacidiphila yanglinensis]
MQGDAVLAAQRDGRLHRSRLVHRPGGDIDDPQPTALVEPQRVQVVVRGDQPDASHAGLPGDPGGSGQQGTADAPAPHDRVQRHDLQFLVRDGVGEQADDPPVLLGQQGRKP